MKNIFTISFLFIGTLCLRSSAFARMPKPFLYMRTFKLDNIISSNAAGDDSLFDAEEAAAIDAHDISDPGLEAAAMERAVMLAEEYKDEQTKKKEMDRRSETCNGGAALIKSLEEQHNKVGKGVLTSDDESLLENEEAAAIDAHDISDPGVEAAAMERAVMLAQEYKEEQMRKKEMDRRSETCNGGAALIKSLEEQHNKVGKGVLTSDDESLLENEEAAAIDAHDISDPGVEAAAMERAVMLAQEYKEEQMKKNSKKRKDHIKSVEEHYKQVEKDIAAIERLIKEADDADHDSGHSLERTFSENDAADLALMMMEKSVIAATDKLELCQEKAKQTEQEVRTALEEKYSAKALAESIERERHTAEMRFLSNKYRNDDVNFSVVHDNDKVLHDAHMQEHRAELRLEKAIEDDITTKKDLEQMIENKAALKESLHELQEIIHEHAALAMEKENNARKSKS